MADKNGYIGRSPSDSSVVIARQQYTPSGIQTDFVFDSGYTVGYLDAYVNGVRLVEATDYTASDGANVGITSYLISGDTLELVAYKAFNVNDVSSTPGNFTVGNDLTVDGGLVVSGVATLGGGSSVSWATTAFNLSGTPDVVVNNITGVAATFTGNVTVGGSLIYEDVTNVDSWGIVTARTGLKIGSPTGVGATLGIDSRGSAIFSGIITASSFSGDITGNATGLSGTPTIDVQDITVNSGIVTVTNLDTTALDTNVAGVIVTGVSTFSGVIDANDTTQSSSSITGAAQFAGGVGVAKNLFVGGGAQVTGISTFVGFSTFKDGVDYGGGGTLREKINIVANKLSAASDINLDNGMVHYFTTTETTTSQPNIISGIGINTELSIGETASVTVITTAAAGGYSTRWKVDGLLTGITTSWVGGSEPSAGNASGLDTYALTLIKTADATYTIINNLVNSA